jgi:predicted HTH domain antitoxin
MKDYLLEVDDPDVRGMVDILEHVAADPERRKELEKERYYQEAMEGTFGEKDRELAKSKRETEEANRKTEEANRKIEEYKQREEELKRKFAIKLKRDGTPLAEIAELTGLSPVEVEEL